MITNTSGFVVCAPGKKFLVNTCWGNFYDGRQLRNMYGDEPYTKIDRVYNLNTRTKITGFARGNLKFENMSAADSEYVGKLSSEQSSPMEVMHYLNTLD